jgi:hypothetical protein
MVDEDDEDELREMSSALSSLIPWKPSNEASTPMPVTVVPKKKRRKKYGKKS